MDQGRLYCAYDTDPAPIAAFLVHLREVYGLPSDGHVLDMGCGPGRLLAPLGAAGFRVTGWEPDPDYAGAARARAEVAEATFREAGLLELDQDAAFDLIALVNGPYAYLLDMVERREALRRCARALRPGGVLFLDLSNFPWILKNYREPAPTEVEVDGVVVRRTARHAMDFHRGVFTHTDRFEWTDAAGDPHAREKTHRMAMVGFPEVRYFLDELGFIDLRTYNGFGDRAPAELTGRRLMVAARRSPAA